MTEETRTVEEEMTEETTEAAVDAAVDAAVPAEVPPTEEPEMEAPAAAPVESPEAVAAIAADSPDTENHAADVAELTAESESAESEPAQSEPAAEGNVAEADTAVTESAETDTAEAPAEEEGGSKTVVRLSVGQEVTGTVKRTTDFGAFVDIGAGRDGLVHISELSVGRVNNVSDVVEAGQTVTAWIKRLDRERNRISLTMISPDTKTIRDLQEGEVVEGTVSRLVPYGAFIDLGIGTDALLHVREMGNSFVAKPEDVVQVGEKLDVRIVSLNRRRRRIDVSIKGLRDEPEPEEQELDEAEAALGVDPDEEVVDQFENIEVLSPMELAFKRAMEGDDASAMTAKRNRGRRRGKRAKQMQEELIQRTLDTMRE